MFNDLNGLSHMNTAKVSVFGVSLGIFPYSAGKCGKNADLNNSEYGHFLRSGNLHEKVITKNGIS